MLLIFMFGIIFIFICIYIYIYIYMYIYIYVYIIYAYTYTYIYIYIYTNIFLFQSAYLWSQSVVHFFVFLPCVSNASKSKKSSKMTLILIFTPADLKKHVSGANYFAITHFPLFKFEICTLLLYSSTFFFQSAQCYMI